ncbi:ribosome assembly RNA-binding protein YhbY [Erysipelotrichaceae bacterium OH741_COT-311]|nr:ribosome assembly RNA-binding protein YhbY [Erysipelotrichaceae bacterium OH741_COT-311]
MLNNKQKKYLRGLANSLRPLFQIGKEGLSFNFVTTLSDSLTAHELVKISVLKSCSDDVYQLAFDLSSETNSEIVQIIGRTILLYRKNRNNPKIEVPNS